MPTPDFIVDVKINHFYPTYCYLDEIESIVLIPKRNLMDDGRISKFFLPTPCFVDNVSTKPTCDLMDVRISHFLPTHCFVDNVKTCFDAYTQLDR